MQGRISKPLETWRLSNIAYHSFNILFIGFAFLGIHFLAEPTYAQKAETGPAVPQRPAVAQKPASGKKNFTKGYKGTKYGKICNALLELLEDDFGALLTALAGLGAIIASAMGGFRMAWSLVIVSVGSFVLRTFKNYWFPGSCA